MNHNLLLAAAWAPVFANSVDAFIPELWANESLMILENNMVVGNLVHRDFENEIQEYGDIVNTRQPATFEAKRKTDSQSVTTQNADATNVPVPLDQHFHVSFMIKDGQESKSFTSLVSEYLSPALLAIATGIDQLLLGQAYRFRSTNVGQLGTDPGKATVIAARAAMNTNLVPPTGRNLIVTPGTEGALLGVDLFVGANQVGDDGTALREGSLGKKYGFETFMSQQTPSITASDVVTGAVNNGAGYAAGATTATVDGFSAAITAGTFFTIAGDDTVLKVVSTVGAGTPTSITFTPALTRAVVDDAVVTIMDPAAVNLGAGYAENYIGDLVINGATLPPRPSQLVSFANVANEYSAMGTPTTIALALDKPLAAAVSNADAINLGPAGDYNFAFHKNALALVTRPLAQPIAGTGALSSVVNYNGLSIRVVITYDGEAQGHRVTVDLLAGTAVLNSSLGMVIYG